MILTETLLMSPIMKIMQSFNCPSKFEHKERMLRKKYIIAFSESQFLFKVVIIVCLMMIIEYSFNSAF